MSDLFRYPKPEALLQIQKDRPTVIEASAGTGKTYTIEHLAVDLLLTTDADIENILVVTFTEKATAELVSRVRQKLRELVELRVDKANGRPDAHCWLVDDEGRHRLRKALTDFERAPISTIHSFCHSILTEYSFLNRRLFEQSQIEEQRVFSRVFTEVLRTELSREMVYHPYLTAWLDSGKVVDALEKLLFECHKSGSPLVPRFEPDRLESAVASFYKAAFQEDEIVSDLKKHKVHASTAGAVGRRLSHLNEATADSDGSDLPHKLEELGEVELDYLIRSVHKAASTEGLLARFQSSVEELDAATVPLESAVAQLFLPPVQKRLNAFKREKGLYDFNDMIDVVAESLEGPRSDELIQALRARYRYALIDEFQDTDSMQWRIFRKIFFESGGKNPLFVIGDPKQAIYAFRGADVHVYLDARETIRGAEGNVLPLADCFRATPALIEATNLILKQDAIAEFFTGTIRYDHPVEPGKPKLRLKTQGGADAPAVVLFQFEWPDGRVLLSNAKKALRSRIAREIDHLLNVQPLHFGEDEEQKPLTAGDIFVLTRSGRDGFEVGAALRELGIPHVYYKQDGLFQTPEAEHVRALLSGIEDPGDRSKRFHAWNTPFFGIKLADLLDCREVPSDHALMNRLLDWKALFESKEFELAFTRILEESGILRRELFSGQNERALTNTKHIFEILLEELGRTRCTLSELIRTLQSFIDGSGMPVGKNADTQRLESDREAVHIMTMHMAKGLEAGVVFLYGGFAAHPGRSKVHSFCDKGKRVAFAGSLSKAPPDVKEAVEREESEEDQRLLYVAMTRAKARLYLPYFPKEEKVLRERSCYGQLNERLRVLLESGQIPGSREKPNPLFHIMNVPVGPQSDEQPIIQKPPDLSDWRPAPGLLLDEDRDTAVRKLEQKHAGFVITSYSRMKSLRGGYRAPIDSGADLADEPDDGVEAPEISRDALPPGPSAGLFFHEVLEAIDFATLKENPDIETWAANEDVRKLFRKMLRRHAFAARYLAHSQRLVHTALTATVQLNGGRPIQGFYQVPRDLREVEFIYPYPESHHPKVADVVEHPFRIERGYVKGFVDFVFEHEGLTYFADWKSDSLPSWEPSALNEHVERNYKLQAQLYALALIKMLDIHSPESYESRFGGLLYLFLRGMSMTGSGTEGIYFERPSWQQLLDWEEELIGKRRL